MARPDKPSREFDTWIGVDDDCKQCGSSNTEIQDEERELIRCKACDNEWIYNEWYTTTHYTIELQEGDS